MPSDLPRLVTRVSEETHNKVLIISAQEKRTVSKQLEFIVEKFIKDYEKSNGTIKSNNITNIINNGKGNVISNHADGDIHMKL